MPTVQVRLDDETNTTPPTVAAQEVSMSDETNADITEAAEEVSFGEMLRADLLEGFQTITSAKVAGLVTNIMVPRIEQVISRLPSEDKEATTTWLSSPLGRHVIKTGAPILFAWAMSTRESSKLRDFAVKYGIKAGKGNAMLAANEYIDVIAGSVMDVTSGLKEEFAAGLDALRSGISLARDLGLSESMGLPDSEIEEALAEYEAKVAEAEEVKA